MAVITASSTTWKVGETYTVGVTQEYWPWNDGPESAILIASGVDPEVFGPPIKILWGLSDLQASILATQAPGEHSAPIFINLSPFTDFPYGDAYCSVLSCEATGTLLEYKILVTHEIPTGGLYLAMGRYGTGDSQEDSNGMVVLEDYELILPYVSVGFVIPDVGEPFPVDRPTGPGTPTPDDDWSWPDEEWGHFPEITAIGGGRYNLKTLAFGKDGGSGVIYVSD